MFLFSPPVRTKKKPISVIFNEKQLDDNLCKNIISHMLNEPESKENQIATNSVYVDLEIFQGNQENTNSIFSAIDNTSTFIGQHYLKKMIKNPTKNIEELHNRQKILKELIKDRKLYESLQEKFKELKELEKSIIWTLKEKNNEEARLVNSVFFTHKYLKALNNNEQVLLFYNYFKIIFSPVYGIFSPIFFLILPYLYLVFFTNIKFDFSTYFKIVKMSFFGSYSSVLFGNNSKTNYTKYLSLGLSFIIYVQNAVNSVNIAIHTNEIINELHKKINDVSRFLELGHSICKDTRKLFGRDEVAECMPILSCQTFKNDPSLLSNKGRILVTFNQLNENKEIFNVLKLIGEIDSYLSICSLVTNNTEKKGQFCFPKYLTTCEPKINTTDLWHPYLNPDDVVTNNIEIDDPQNIIITGPNAGGKSTTIKSLAISLLLGQTICVCSGTKAEFTPFSLINTYLNIPDCKGKESLFEAEMHRSRDHIKLLETLSKNDFAFVIMDEIFSSTNPDEGISGGYAIANKLSTFSNSIAVITTHYNHLTTLEKSGKFKNLKIPIDRDQKNNIIYPYKIYDGVSDQFIALELLKEKGFDLDIVNMANDVCQEIQKSKVSLNSNNDDEGIEDDEEDDVVEEALEENVEENVEEAVEEKVEEKMKVKEKKKKNRVKK